MSTAPEMKVRKILDTTLRCQEARVMIHRWRCHYNEELTHSSLGFLSHAEFRCK